METKFSYTIVGLFVIIFSIVFFIVTIWLSAGVSAKKYHYYTVYMAESVSGLSVKAPVKYNGVDVGYVNEISLRENEPSQVQILLSIEEHTPVTVDTRAELDSQGITGVGYIELTGGKPHAAPLKAKSGERYPVIPTEPSLMFRLDNVLDHLSSNIDVITDGLKRLVNTENTSNLRDILQNLNDLSSKVDSQSDQIQAIISNADITLKNTAEASEDFPELTKELKQAAQTFDSISVDIKKASQEAKTTFENSSVMVENINQQVLPGFIRAMNKMQSLLESMDNLTEQLDENPSVIIRGRAPQKPGPGER